jgi:hypothetical protein
VPGSVDETGRHGWTGRKSGGKHGCSATGADWTKRDRTREGSHEEERVAATRTRHHVAGMRDGGTQAQNAVSSSAEGSYNYSIVFEVK